MVIPKGKRGREEAKTEDRETVRGLHRSAREKHTSLLGVLIERRGALQMKKPI